MRLESQANTLKQFGNFAPFPLTLPPPSLFQCCCSHVTLASHLNIAKGKGSPWVFQGFLLRIVASKICIILYIIEKPNSMTVELFVPNIS